MIKIIETITSKLSSILFKQGNLIVCKDTGEVYFDSLTENAKRIPIAGGGYLS